MSITTYSQEQKEQILKEVGDTGNAKLVAAKHGIPASTVHTWTRKSKNAAVTSREKSVKQLKKELADKDLENKILKDLLKKTNQAWLKE